MVEGESAQLMVNIEPASIDDFFAVFVDIEVDMGPGKIDKTRDIHIENQTLNISSGQTSALIDLTASKDIFTEGTERGQLVLSLATMVPHLGPPFAELGAPSTVAIIVRDSYTIGFDRPLLTVEEGSTMSVNVVIRPAPGQQDVSVRLVPLDTGGAPICFGRGCPHLPESPGSKEIIFEARPGAQQSSVEAIIGVRENKRTQRRQMHLIEIDILPSD